MTKDPFFTLAGNTAWNACIGKQGDELNYLDGYIEAAFELADVVITKNMVASRDTLVLPILYNTRHAIELLLKFVIDQLSIEGILNHSRPRDHNIKAHFRILTETNTGDETLRLNLVSLSPYIESLTRIDGDGQELRYHLDQAGKASLDNYSLANLEVIRASIKILQEIVEKIKYRTLEFTEERRIATHTKWCSRRDLSEIARTLPLRSDWNSDEFSSAKSSIMDRFSLSNVQFSKSRSMKILSRMSQL